VNDGAETVNAVLESR